MRPIYHLLISGGIAAAQWAVRRDSRGPGWTLVSGTLIDLDHVPDYILSAGKEQIRLSFVLHSWELWGIIGAVAWRRAGPAGALAAVGSPLLHMLLDIWGNRVPPRFFSFVWRARHGFRIEMIRKNPDRRLFPGSIAEIPSFVVRNAFGPLRRPMPVD